MSNSAYRKGVSRMYRLITTRTALRRDAPLLVLHCSLETIAAPRNWTGTRVSSAGSAVLRVHGTRLLLMDARGSIVTGELRTLLVRIPAVSAGRSVVEGTVVARSCSDCC